jgi:hypothetical protein
MERDRPGVTFFNPLLPDLIPLRTWHSKVFSRASSRKCNVVRHPKILACRVTSGAVHVTIQMCLQLNNIRTVHVCDEAY